MYRNRYRKITFFFGRHLLNILILDLILPHIGFRTWSEKSRPSRLGNIARQFRELAIDMGGVLIKVGQFLSTRVDVLPPEFINELIGLQDEVPPEDFKAIREVVEIEFSSELEMVFYSIDPTPLAAASLGQVHKAKLFKSLNQRFGTSPIKSSINQNRLPDDLISVVVKIQRPDIEKIIDIDLRALQTVGGWLQRYRPIKRRINLPALLNEFTRILHEEIDYINEGKNAEIFASNFNNVPQVRVPEVIWSHTTKRVLTLENVWGIKISDFDGMSKAGVARSDVANLLIDTYLKQIFEDGFFHADPHPGNLFINPIPIMPPIPAGNVHRLHNSEVFWQLTFVDFGMAGIIPDNMKEGLRELLIGIGTKDISRVIKSYQMMNIILPGADIDQLKQAGADVFELFWGRNMSELTQVRTEDVIKITKDYRQLIYSLPIQIPQNIIFLGRAIGILSGICTGLDPEFNLFDHLAPYTQQLIIEQIKPDPTKILQDIGSWLNTIYQLPLKLDELTYKLDQGEVSIKIPEVNRQITRVEGAIRAVALSLIFSSLLLGGIQLKIANEDLLAYILFSSALVTGAAWLWGVIRR